MLRRALHLAKGSAVTVLKLLKILSLNFCLASELQWDNEASSETEEIQALCVSAVHCYPFARTTCDVHGHGISSIHKVQEFPVTQTKY